MIQAKCYGVWGAHHYYRTESGHTFSIAENARGKIVFYHGNVKQKYGIMKMLNESEKTELFQRIEFVD